MFGGYGIYWQKIMFASIYNQTLYFRIDNHNLHDYASYKSLPFVYEYKKSGKKIILPYLTVPTEILEDPRKLPRWIKKSCEASIRGKKKES
jgi:DNA transformation protein